MNYELVQDGQQNPIYGIPGLLYMARFYDPGGAETDLSLEEDVGTPNTAREFFGSVDAGDLPDSDSPYEYEVREVSALTSDALDAAIADEDNIPVIRRGTYGYAVGGAWQDAASSPEETDPSSLYIDYDEFIARFGLRNVARHSSADQDTMSVPNKDRVQFSFDAATEQLHSFFSSGPYTVPFEFSDSTTPAVVRRWAMNLAYADLYLARGMSDEKQPTKIQLLQENTLKEMAVYRAGIKELSTATRRSGMNSSPAVVSSTEVKSNQNGARPDSQPVYGWIYR